MIPAGTIYAPGGWLLYTPNAGQVPAFMLGAPVVLAYKEGAQDFVATAQEPPFDIDYIQRGSFDAAITAGFNDSLGFGVRVELRRNGVYGTILVDSVLLTLHPLNVDVEHCPDPTPSLIETHALVAASVEGCPTGNVYTAESSVTVPYIEE